MKIRVFLSMDDSVFRVLINTEDWSERDLELMVQYGEPEINVGGDVTYTYSDTTIKSQGASARSASVDPEKTVTFGDEYVRVLHGFPYMRSFDSRDYSSVGEARAVGNEWKEIVIGRIEGAVDDLRASFTAQIPTEEVVEI